MKTIKFTCRSCNRLIGKPNGTDDCPLSIPNHLDKSEVYVIDQVGCVSHSEFKKILDEISESINTCAFYDDKLSAEGGCVGNRNQIYSCKKCQYFEIDGNQVKTTIECIRSELES